MATEDIRVEHRANVPTAYFDTKNRVLCLPIWQDMTDSVYDMLVGHEVSHALHTPSDGWQDFIGKGKGSGMRHMFVNVVEDARIERLIKDKFPGIRRDFANAYRTLHTQDLFELKGRTIDNMPLIDRLNLHFKVGLFGLETIPFTNEEKPFVTRMAETTTFDEVVALAEELYNRQVDEDAENDQDGESTDGDSQSGDGEGQQNPFGDTPEDQDGESTDGDSQSGDGEGDQDDDEYGSGSGNALDDENQDGSESNDQDGSESNDQDGSESGDQDGESTDGDSENGRDPSGLDYDDYSNNQSCAGSTQRNFEQNVNDFRDENGGEYRYHTLPEMHYDQIIVDYSVIGEIWDRLSASDSWDRFDRYAELRNKVASNLQTFLNQSKPVVNQMVQQFQMKQAADASHRTQINKTGVLDTVTMINYRWSEDIFRKNETHADGKNHGMVIYVDWSGSMSGILQDTVEQLLILVEFCRKVGIPYEVYAFSSNRYYPTLEGLEFHSDEYIEEMEKIQERLQYTRHNEDTDVSPHEFQLYNYLSSRMNNQDYKTALKNLWLLTHCQTSYGGHPHPRCLHMGCTPLNEAVVSAMDIIPAFQQSNGVQIMNAVFLTDGEGHGMGLKGYYSNYGRNNKDILRDSKTHKTYELNNNGRRAETDVLLTLLKDKTGCNTIGVRLHASKTLRNMRYQFFSSEDNNAFEAACKSYTKNNYATIQSAYDEYFIVKGNLKVEFDALEGLEEGASNAKIKNAFMKGNNSKKSSRVIASKMVEIFAA